MYEFKPLTSVSYKEISDCVNLAFSDYQFKPQFNEVSLEEWFVASDVDRKLSFGIFLKGKMVGFIINSCNIYNGVKVVFDIATAVIPEHRGNKLFTSLYDYAEQQIKNKGVEKYYLEVLQQNEKAIKIYTKKGFRIEREFSVLKGQSTSNYNDDFNKIKMSSLNEFNMQRTSKCVYLPPSYENSTSVLSSNIDLYQVIYCEDKEGITAFCIYSKNKGNIAQIGYYSENDLRVLIKKLVSTYQGLIVKNIDLKYTQILDVLYDLRFIEMTKQFEMCKQL